MYGRSDATLNPGGVRIGTAEIYRIIEQMEVKNKDALKNPEALVFFADIEELNF
jgi:acyl-coenzyme A synthetase/AMP-(fatty) acid ligase